MQEPKVYEELARYMKRYKQLHKNIETLENMLKEQRGNLNIFKTTGENISNSINNRFYRAYMPPKTHTIIKPQWTEVNALLKRYPIAIMHAKARKNNMLKYLGRTNIPQSNNRTVVPRFPNSSNLMFDQSMKYNQRTLKERMLNKNYRITEKNKNIRKLLQKVSSKF